MRNSFRAKKAEWKRLKGRYRLLRDTVAKRLFNNILVGAGPKRNFLVTSTDVAFGKPTELTLWDQERVERLMRDLSRQVAGSGIELECEVLKRGKKKNLRAIAITAQVSGGSHFLKSADLSLVRRLYRKLHEKGV